MSAGDASGADRKLPRPLVAIVGTIVLILAGVVIGSLLAEAAYRVYLYTTLAPERFVRPVRGGFAVNDKPMWRYDERFGYVYPRGEEIHIAGISGGRVTSCQTFRDFNREGNVGRIVGDYATADVRILAFGDSFTATSHDGITWPLLLQERLSERLGRSVHVVNYGRDGYGMLQMFDLAAAKVTEHKPKPDLVIIAFITNDLQRVRIWRAVTTVDGRWRHLVSPEPTPNPDPAKSYDTAIYHPGATPEWCKAMKASGSRDRVIDEVEKTYKQGISVGEQRVPSILALGHSYLLARVLHGDPFRDAAGPFSFPMIQYDSYAEDSRFVESLRTLEASGVPYVLFHLAIYPELRSGREFIVNHHESRLLKSLAAMTHKPIFETTRYVQLSEAEQERLIKSPEDHHPSLAGLRFYADAIAEMLIRERFVR